MLCSKHSVHDGSIDQKRERTGRRREWKDLSFYPVLFSRADLYELTSISSVFLLNGLGQSEALAGKGRVGMGIKRSQGIYSLISLPAWLWSSYISLPQTTAPSPLRHNMVSGFCKLFTLLVPSDLGIAMHPPCC